MAKWYWVVSLLFGCLVSGCASGGVYTGRVINSLPERITVHVYGPTDVYMVVIDPPEPGYVGKSSELLSVQSGFYEFAVFLENGKYRNTERFYINRVYGDTHVPGKILGLDHSENLDWVCRIWPQKGYY